MAKAALAKLLILVVLVFIICILEFFRTHRGPRVNFLCTPCRPAGDCDWLKKRQEEESARENSRQGGGCDPCLALGSDPPQPEPVCTAGDQGNGTDPGSDYGGPDWDRGNAWFMCETDMEEAQFRGSSSSLMSESPKRLEAWMAVQPDETVHLNLVSYERRNSSSWHLRPPAEPDEEADRRQSAFYCCLPPPPLANRSRCLVRLANQTAAAAKRALPWELTGKKDEWGGVFTALWMALTGVLLLLVLASLLTKVYQRRANKGPLCGKNQESHLNGSCPSVDTSTGIILSTLGLPYRTVQTPIQEDQSVDSNDPPGRYTAHLHHRGHHALSSISEEQAL